MNRVGRILNGQNSAVLPYQVRLKVGCGGAIIKPDWILTAKHCVINNERPFSTVALAGISNLNDESHAEVRNIPVRSMILHETAGQ